jgi:uncharacterized membrane protein YeaQ/YmgE (transglycosylase-associated protein family)
MPHLGVPETRGKQLEVVMGILAWIVLGLVAGAIAKLILPGTQGGGWFLTLILGVVGSIIVLLIFGATRRGARR